MNDLERSLTFASSPEQISYVKSLPDDDLPNFSVVIPSFNQSAFLRQSIDSVIQQKYPKIEIFVADGGSTDGSDVILQEYFRAYPRILRFESGPDGGHHHGVNKGIANTSGEIIAWINSDDVYLPDAFWKVAAFFHFNHMAQIVYGRNSYVDRDLNHIAEYPVDWSPLISEQRRRMMHFCIVPQPSLFFKRTAVTLCGALDSTILDYELWLRWQQHLPFYFCDDHFSLSRVHDDAISANADRRLLRGICKTVHQYYGIVPLSWAFKYAYTAEYGAAWARGEAPVPSLKVRVLARWHWLAMNVSWLPSLVSKSVRGFWLWVAQACRVAS